MIVLLFGERLLPHRSARAGSRDFSDHVRTLVEQYGLGGRRRADVAAIRGGRGDDPAPVGADRRRRLPGDGDRERRPRRAGSAAQGRGRAGRDRARGRRHPPARGNVGGARAPSRRSRAPRRRQARPRPPPGGAARPGREADARHPRGDGRPPRHRRSAAGGRRPAGRRGDGRHARAHDRGGVPQHLLDDRHPRRRDDLALDRDDRDRRSRPARRQTGADRRRLGLATPSCSASSCSRPSSVS